MSAGLSGPVCFFGGMMLMGLSPLIRGGNRHVALVLLEWLALIVLLALMAQGLKDSRRTHGAVVPSERLFQLAIGAFALAPLWTAVLQLVPLPASLWGALPGRALYAEALAVAKVSDSGYFALSLTPDATWTSVMAGLPLVAAFLLAQFCSSPQLHRLVQALVVFAAAQAVLGLLQMGPFPGLSFGSVKGGRAIGTFANRNHFASYITMTVPLAILLSQCVARLPPIALMQELPYVTSANPEEGAEAKSRLVARATRRELSVAGAWVALLVASVWFAGGISLGRVLVMGLALAGSATLMGMRFHRRAGGITGDFLVQAFAGTATYALTTVEGATVLIPDPMGATGGSLCEVLRMYREDVPGPARRLVAMHLIVTPEHIARVSREAPDVQIYAVRVDRGLSAPDVLDTVPGERHAEERGLNDHQYIVPGAGGLGELMNNSWV